MLSHFKIDDAAAQQTRRQKTATWKSSWMPSSCRAQLLPSMVARYIRYSIYQSPARRCDAIFRLSHHGTRWAGNATKSSATSPPKHTRGRWLRIAVVTVAAGGIGAFIRSKQECQDPTLNPLTFTKYELVSKTPISSTNSVFSFRPITQGQGNDRIYQDAWECGVWSVQFKQPQLQVGRDYTPLPPEPRPSTKRDNDDSKAATTDEPDETLRFLIRRDPYGEVSGYLHGLKIGSIVEMRGPQIEFDISRDVDEILFIAGGTGIAPALQAAHNIFDHRESKANTRLHILWANRRREDCTGGQNDLAIPSTADGKWWSKIFPAAAAAAQQSDPRPDNEIQGWTVKQLEELKKSHPGQFTVDYFVDEEKTLVTKESIIRFINSTARTPHGDSSRRKKLILISGPDGFISYLAGPKLWTDGYESQGPLSGILRELNLTDWIIWKL